MKSLLSKITCHISQIDLKENIDLTRFSTMKLKSEGDIIEVFSLEALQKLIKTLNENSYPYRLIGWGANTLLSEQAKEVLIKLSFKNYKIIDFDEKNESYTLPACFPLPFLVKMAEKHGLDGFECLTGIPASVGGATFMNAGTRLGEIGDLVSSVKFVKIDGSLAEHKVGEGSFSYRKNNFIKPGEVIYEVTLTPKGFSPEVKNKIREYRNYRSESQPLTANSCGCIFKNQDDVSAGKLIDELGLKGLKFKDLEISTLHANFILNRGGATLGDFKEFVELIKKKILEEKGINIECEVRYD